MTPEPDPDTAPIPLVLVPKLNLIPVRRGGSRLHIRTVFRWALTGLSGVKLRSTLVGGQRCTTRKFLAEFFAAVDAARRTGTGSRTGPPAVQYAKVDESLDRLGL